VSVWDGDGPVWCAEGPRVRLSGIAAREMGGSCRSNQPCPDATAAQARDALVGLIGVPTGRSMEGHVLLKGPAMRCTSVGNGVGNRTAAWCVSPVGGDVSSWVRISAGWYNGSASSRISELTPDSYIFRVARLRFERARLTSF
jgi:hypothetical protein